MPKKKEGSAEISVLEIQQGEINFAIVGRTPLILNRVAEKARRELLLPHGRKTAADRAANLKHSPFDEYRASVYRNPSPSAKTRLIFPAPGFKGAMCTAALDLPGTRKAEIGRLVWVTGTHVDIYGVPQLKMDVVRSADIARTPDIRTRAIVPEWACVVSVQFVRPKLNETALGHLMAAAGITAGIGDFRQEKGKGNFGQFSCVDLTDKNFKRIVEAGGRKAQDAALENPECYDAETEELLSWFVTERDRRYGKRRNDDEPMPEAAE